MVANGVDLRCRQFLIGFRPGQPVLARKTIKQIPSQSESCIPGFLVWRVNGWSLILLSIAASQTTIAIEAQGGQISSPGSLDLGPCGTKLLYLLHEVRALRQGPVD